MNTEPEIHAQGDNLAKTISPESKASKLLSILMVGRDDDYMLDFKYRITTTINYVARNLKQLGRLDGIEILVTDWGSEVPLAETLPLSPESREICCFIYVQPDLAKALYRDGDGFQRAIAMNAGVRRARGSFLLSFAADTLIPWYSLESLLRLLDGKLPLPVDTTGTYFLCSRYQVPWKFVRGQPSLEEWDRYLFLSAGNLQAEEAALLSIGKGIGACMMHRSLWRQIHGFDERLDSWGWHDVDLALRATQNCNWVELSSIGVSLFHMEHPRSGRRDSIVRESANPPIFNLASQSNEENWGLGNYKLEIQSPQTNDVCEYFNDRLSTINGSESVHGELTGSNLRNHLRRIIRLAEKTGWNMKVDEIDTLSFLSWYSLYHHPRRYVEFGVKDGCTTAAVADACSGIEIYAIGSWNGVLYRNSPRNIAGVLCHHTGHHGYVRFINGDLNTAFDRLQQSFIGSFFFDLVLVRGDLLGANALKQVSDLLRVLAAGGALVFTCTSSNLFESVWNELRTLFPDFTYLPCKKHRTGLILNALVKDLVQKRPNG